LDKRLIWALLVLGVSILLLLSFMHGRWVPQDDRQWEPYSERMPSASVTGTAVTIGNVRDSLYDDADFASRYGTRTVDTNNLTTR
jgi:hypothetical protein